MAAGKMEGQNPMENTVTILTPTFNRERVLPELYQSLKDQTSKVFEWLIVDDGSSDHTQDIVKKWIAENKIDIRYLYKENGGKHTALNFAIKQIESELTFIVDSDDILTPDAVETILRYHKKYQDEKNLCGYAFLRAFPDGKISGKEFAQDEKIASYIEVRINSDDTMADKAEVFKTACLKEFPFPEYPGERFLAEDVVWVRMARRYRMVHINKAIYIGGRLEDGLTKHRRLNNIKSPVGCMNRAKEFMKPDIDIKHRTKAALQHIIYGKFAGVSVAAILGDSPDKKLTLACLAPGLILQKIWKRKYAPKS